MRLQEAFKDLKAQSKAWYPSITLKTALSSSASEASNTFDFPIILGSISIDLPFLNWNTVKNNISIAEADYESRRLDFTSSINTALNEVTYYSAYTNNKKSLKNMQIKYQAGKVEFKNLLDNMNTANESKLNFLDQSYQLIKYENIIFKAMSARYSNNPSSE